MPRKGTKSDQVALVNRRYRGAKKFREAREDGSLADFERTLKQERLAYLKAQDFSHAYCADALGVTVETIKDWLSDERYGLRNAIELVHAEIVGGTVKLIESYLIEITETLMDIFRTTEDEALAVKVGLELYDRVGIVKVAKSESTSDSRVRSEVDITDKTGLVGLVKDAPPNVQQKMAEAAERMIAMAQEHASDA